MSGTPDSHQTAALEGRGKAREGAGSPPVPVEGGRANA